MAFNGKDFNLFKNGTPFAAATDGTVTINSDMPTFANKEDGGFEAALPGTYELQASGSNLLDTANSGTEYITEIDIGIASVTSLDCEITTTGTFTMNVIQQDCKGNVDSNGRQFRVVSPGTVSGNIQVQARIKLDGSGTDVFAAAQALKKGDLITWRVKLKGGSNYANATGYVETVDVAAPDNDSATFTVTFRSISGGNVLVSPTQTTLLFRRSDPTDTRIDKYFLANGFVTNETFTFTQNEAPTGTFQFQSTGEFLILDESS